MAVALQGEELQRSFGAGELRTVALAEVSLELHAGRMTLLMGPSGSGKSTLLAVLSGLLRPDGGRVAALGTELWKLSDPERERFRLRHCGFIFQGYNLFPALSACEQVQLVLEWGSGLGAGAARQRARELLDDLGLASRAHLRPQALSGGEKQRVAVARALAKEPSLIFADEPTASLDWEHGQQVAALLRQAAHERQATVLLVSHDTRLASMADEVVHLEDGRITGP